jgi:ribonuclease HI
MAEKGLLEIWTDGSCEGNGRGGFGGGAFAGSGVFFAEGDPRNVSRPVTPADGPAPTNQVAELIALHLAVEAAARELEAGTCDFVRIHTDSAYSRSCVTEWARGWARNGWRNSKGEAVAHRRWIEPTVATLARFPGRVDVAKIKAHAGHAGNEAADALARAGTDMAREAAGAGAAKEGKAAGKAASKRPRTEVVAASFAFGSEANTASFAFGSEANTLAAGGEGGQTEPPSGLAPLTPRQPLRVPPSPRPPDPPRQPLQEQAMVRRRGAAGAKAGGKKKKSAGEEEKGAIARGAFDGAAIAAMLARPPVPVPLAHRVDLSRPEARAEFDAQSYRTRITKDDAARTARRGKVEMNGTVFELVGGEAVAVAAAAET